jgi:hypothetical protein
MIMIKVKHLFGDLDRLLIELLKSLNREDWDLPTSAILWSIKDVTSHLLDTNLRTLSIQRDGYFGEKAPQFGNYQNLVDWLNQLNSDWVKATKRLSPAVLIHLLEITGKEVTQYYESLPETETAIFPVAWAGEEQSLNWMHLAREYTEKWHHQQQIREAAGKEGILESRFFEPLMDTFMQALPYTFKGQAAKELTAVQVSVKGKLNKDYFLVKLDDKWELKDLYFNSIASSVSIPESVAWKLFCKNLRAEQVLDQIEIKGDAVLGKKVLEMVAVMA